MDTYTANQQADCSGRSSEMDVPLTKRHSTGRNESFENASIDIA